MTKIAKLILLLLCLVFFFSCSNEVVNNKPTSTVHLSVNNTTARTLLPNAITPAKAYVFTLTSTTEPSTVYTAESKQGSVSIENVLLGTYSVNVKGYKDIEKTSLIQEGNSSENLVVDIASQNAITIQMELIQQDGLTGAITIPVNWSQVVSHPTFAEALDNGLRFDLYLNGKLQDNSQTIIGSDYPNNEAELTFENIPTGIGQMVMIKIYNSVTGQMLVRNFFTSLATVYSGHTSTPDANEANSGYITPNMIITASNISNVSVSYNDENLNTALDITWDNPETNGKNQAKTVIIKYATEGEEEREQVITFDEANAANDLKGKTTLSSLTPGAPYTIKYSVQYFNGMYSAEKKLPYKKAPYVFVESLTIEDGSIPNEAISEGDAFPIKATLLPENASDKTINWSTSSDGVLSYNKGLFEAHKPGKATITATTTGYINSNKEPLTQTCAKEVTVILKTPQVYAETNENVINVHWDSIPYAENYELYEIIDGVEQNAITLDAATTTYTRNTGIKAGATYSYYVKAKAPSYNTDDFTADSKNSDKTAEITPIMPNITVLDPIITASPTLSFTANSVDRVITPDQKTLIFSIQNPNSDYTYSWYINGEMVDKTQTDGNSIIITKDTEGVYQDSNNNSLLLKVEHNGKTYSATTTFDVIAVMDEGVEVYVNGETDGACYILTSAKTVQLSYQVLPEDASNQTVTFTSSNQEVATVNEDGLITILSYGDVTITVKPVHGKASAIDFKFYDQTFNSQLEILNAVNSVLRTHIEAANSQFKGDWWPGISAKKYTSSGITILSSNSTNQSYGSITISNLESSSDKGAITLNTTEEIQTWATNGEGAGYLGTDPLHMIGYNNKGTIKVNLPYNQGSVSIHYNNIVVDSSRSGSYSLTFEPIKVGGKEYHFMSDTTFNDKEDITRLLN